jgi:DNA-binding NarL/FixJ family response regulator
MKLIYLEDNRYDRKIFKSVVSSYLAEIDLYIAKNKEEYLGILSEIQPDIIVSDFNLPDISGIEAFEYANVVLSDFSFVLFSSYLTDEQVKKCIQNGITRIVMKENMKGLVSQIEDAISLMREIQT